MGKKEILNPLFEPQREKVGAETYADYGYQYHWALYRVIEEHEKSREYAVFVEYHEDVLIADSLDKVSAKFELNQVKAIGKKLSTADLIRLKNGKSILGKLISSGINKSFSSKIESINLVSINDFELELKKEGVKLQKITIPDISDKQYRELEDAIKIELSTDKLPASLQFIVPELSEKNYQNDIIALISKLITNLFPGSHYNSVDIYRILIDEVNKKGIITYDYNNWDDLIAKKALTSLTVTNVINSFTNIKDEVKIEAALNDILSELKINTIQGVKLRRAFGRYRQNRISNNSSIQKDITIEIVDLINSNIISGEEQIENLIRSVSNQLSSKLKRQFTDEVELKSAIICEFIMNN